MLQFHPNATHSRYVAPIPGVPESQARALDRRLKLNRQLQEFRGDSRGGFIRTPPFVNAQAGPAPE